MTQWRNNRECKACSARRPSAVGGPTLFFKVFWGEEGALLEYLHAGPLQPCYATAMTPSGLYARLCHAFLVTSTIHSTPLFEFSPPAVPVAVVSSLNNF